MGDVAYWYEYTNQAFSEPPIFNIDTLLSQVKAGLDATSDRLWLLQTDPSYMHRQIRLINEYQIIKGATRPEAYRMITAELCPDVNVIWFWQRVHSEFEKDPITSKTEMKRKTKNDIKDVFEKDLLDWCLHQLQGAPDEQRRFDHVMLFNFLDDHLAVSSAKERARLDEILFHKLSDYAAIHEMLVAIRPHQPQNANRALDVFAQDCDRRAWRPKRKERNLKLKDNDSWTFASLLRKFYWTEIPSGRKDCKRLQRFNATHTALEKFRAEAYRYFSSALCNLGR